MTDDHVDYTITDALVGGAALFAARAVLRETPSENRLAAEAKFFVTKVSAASGGPHILDLTEALKRFDANVEAASFRTLNGLATSIAVISVPNLEHRLALVSEIHEGRLSGRAHSEVSNIMCLRLPVDDQFPDHLEQSFGQAIDVEGSAAETPNAFWLSVTHRIALHETALANVTMLTSPAGLRVSGTVLPTKLAEGSGLEEDLLAMTDRVALGSSRTARPGVIEDLAQRGYSKVHFISIVARARVKLVHDVIADLDSANLQVVQAHMAILEGRTCASFVVASVDVMPDMRAVFGERIRDDFMRFSVFESATGIEEKLQEHWPTPAPAPWRCNLEVAAKETHGVIRSVVRVIAVFGLQVTSMDSAVVDLGDRECQMFFALESADVPPNRVVRALEARLEAIPEVVGVKTLPSFGLTASHSRDDLALRFEFDLVRVDVVVGQLEVRALLLNADGPKSVKLEVWGKETRLAVKFVTLGDDEQRVIGVTWEPVKDERFNLLITHEGRIVWQRSLSAGQGVMSGS